jgi:hypothetical protein
VTWEPTATTIAWTVSNEYDNVQVYDDGQLLASQSHSGEIQLRDVDSEEHQYSVIASREVTEDEFREIVPNDNAVFSGQTPFERVAIIGASPLAFPECLTPGYSSLLGCEKTQTAGGTR